MQTQIANYQRDTSILTAQTLYFLSHWTYLWNCCSNTNFFFSAASSNLWTSLGFKCVWSGFNDRSLEGSVTSSSLQKTYFRVAESENRHNSIYIINYWIFFPQRNYQYAYLPPLLSNIIPNVIKRYQFSISTSSFDTISFRITPYNSPQLQPSTLSIAQVLSIT